MTNRTRPEVDPGVLHGADCDGVEEKTVITYASNFYRVDDGLIVDEVGQPDVLSILGQIGALPSALG